MQHSKGNFGNFGNLGNMSNLFDHIKIFAILFVFVLLSSCATSPINLQPQINSLIVANKPAKVVKLLAANPNAYGTNNQLLYLLDKSLVLHLAHDYTKSIKVFEETKLKFDELYTHSITKGLGTWVINDYTAPYHGEDFEHVLVNIFQALNFAALDNFVEALVEAREVDSKLWVINSQYAPDQKNVYKEDAFARFLMGILYEANQTPQDDNDAFISYRRAAEIYTKDYAANYGLSVPKLLQDNLLAASQFMGPAELREYQRRYPEAEGISLKEKQKKAQVYLIQYNGLIPIKIQSSIAIPLPDGFVARLAFPKYHERFYEIIASQLIAENKKGGRLVSESELAQDLAGIAVKNLENRKIRVLAKAALRPAGKYFLERAGEKGIRERYGDDSALGFKIGASLFNLASERADLRSWQSLPAQIRIARLILEPGEYDLSLENFNGDDALMEELRLGSLVLKAGQIKFLIVRTVK